MAAIFPVGGLNTLLNIKQLSRRYTNEVDQGTPDGLAERKGMKWLGLESNRSCIVACML